MIIVELLLKVVFIYVRDALKPKDLYVVCSLRVHLMRFPLDLSKPVFVVSSLNVLITTTSANVCPSVLVFLLC